MAIRITLIVEHGGKRIKVDQNLTSIAGSAANRAVREMILEAANIGVRSFRDERSPYSDDLFKMGKGVLGVVEKPSVQAEGD